MKYILTKNKLLETVQQAEKIYYKTGKIPEYYQNMIASITKNGGKNYTKLLADVCYYYLQNFVPDTIKYIRDPNIDSVESYVRINVRKFYNQLMNYNKNVFPIDFEQDTYGVIKSFEMRDRLLKHFENLPSIAKRNLKSDIREVRNYSTIKAYLDRFNYFMAHYSLLSNRSEEVKRNFDKKLFRNNTTLDDLEKFVDDKEEFIGGTELTKSKIIEMEGEEDFDIVYQKDNVMILEVWSVEGIKAIGCNSLWCFTYGYNNWRDWNAYSYNDRVYIIVDLDAKTDDRNFMHVLIKPLYIVDEDEEYENAENGNSQDDVLFDMANDPDDRPNALLKSILGDNYAEIVKKYMNFYED